MPSDTPRKGDRVRVVLEGTVADSSYGGDPAAFCVGAGGHHANLIVPSEPQVVSVEILPPPEPDWQPGDVVRTPLGVPYIRNSAGWITANGVQVRDVALPRPLTRLVPEATS